MKIKKVAIIGAGLMGHGIAQVAAQVAGYEVHLKDIKQEFLDKGMGRIKWSLGKLVEKEKLTQDDVDAVLRKIHPTLDMKTAVGEADIVIEAAPEKLQLKQTLFEAFDEFAPDHAILASNTSSISINTIAEATKQPDKVVGMHFFNPPQIMRLVEIIRGEKTSDETVAAVVEVSQKMGKETVLCKKDVPGFIVNRVLIPALLDAIRLVQDDVASLEDIDKAIQLGLNWPMGPIRLLDYVGLDTTLSITEVFQKGLDEHRYETPALLEKMVKEGKLGRKTKQGFYDW
ncbi:MAG: 3-hydroxyacyl-CoA dehydrogenase family protein [Promethearchaeota archaeon]